VTAPVTHCPSCGVPLSAVGQCEICGRVWDASKFPSSPTGPLPPASAEPPGAWRGVHGVSVAGLGPVDVVESTHERYVVEFANGRRETVSAAGTLFVGGTPGVRPHPNGERILVAFADGVHYAGRVVGVEPGRHLVRSRADGREAWVTDGDLLTSFA